MATLRGVLAAENRGASRALGGLLLAIGAVALLTRRTSFEDPWSDFVLFVVLFALAESLFWSGFFGARWSDSTRPWQTIYLLIGVGLTPVYLFQFVAWIDGDTSAPLNTTWIFLVTASAALIALHGARVRVAAVAAAVAIVVAWAGLCAEVLDNGFFDDIDDFRWVIFFGGVLLLPFAGAISASRAPEGSAGDFLTVAGASAVLAGAVYFVLPYAFIVPEGIESEAATTLFWDLELLIVSLGLIGIAASGALNRGPGYLGAFGVAAFAFSVGLDLDDSSPAGKVLGWPLILLVLGGIFVLASIVPELRRRRT